MSQMIPNTTCLSTKSTLFSILKIISIKKKCKKKWNSSYQLENEMKHEAIAMLSQCWCHIFVSSRSQREITRQWCKIDFWLKRKILEQIFFFFLLVKTKNQSSSQKMLHENPTRHKLFKTWHETKGDECCLYMRAREHRWNQSGVGYYKTQVEMI